MQHTVHAVGAGSLNARALANVAYGAAHGERGARFSVLFVALASRAERCLRDFKPQEFTNMAWALATAGQSDVPLFVALKPALAKRLGDFNA